jgi:exoribonuclease R
MISLKIIIHDREYSSWSISADDSFREIIIENSEFHPAKSKLFTKDVFLYDTSTNSVSLKYSHIRSGTPIAGILLLSQNKTFGRTKNKKRLLYKCIPDDSKIPAFLIPYEPTVGFSKTQKNKYVLFKFDNWDDQHPHGLLIDVLGDVDKLETFYEYQLHCKTLNSSLTTFTNAARDRLRATSDQEYINRILHNPDYEIEDRRDHRHIFSIDPQGSMDFDDAFSIEPAPDGNYMISIYIANVYVWLETLNLWKSFSNRVATIYLPDRKRPMLPTVLSDSLCSLQEGVTRFAFAMDITMSLDGIIRDVSYKNVAIQVCRNYRYEEHALIYENPDYTTLFDITKSLDKSVKDSHDVVSYWMIKMNSICADYMVSHQIGIFRKVQHTNTTMEYRDLSENMSHSAERMIRMWNNISGQYVAYGPYMNLTHDVMKIKNYTHMTSPIRRLIDLLNQMWFLDKMDIKLSVDSREFLDNWISKIDYINTAMRSIRKIQTDCEVLHRCYVQPDILSTIHKGVIFDKLQKSDGAFVYMVYLEGLNMLSRMKSYTEFDNYRMMDFKVYLFEDEHSLKKKVRVQHIE